MNKETTFQTARIKDVYLELAQRPFFHGYLGSNKHSTEGNKEIFVGRERPLSKLKALLKDSSSKSGAYLVTGFRGMGKTSMVHKAITEVNADVANEKAKYRYEVVNISLSQDDIKDKLVLRQIARQTFNRWSEEKLGWRIVFRYRIMILLMLSLVVMGLFASLDLNVIEVLFDWVDEGLKQTNSELGKFKNLNQSVFRRLYQLIIFLANLGVLALPIAFAVFFLHVYIRGYIFRPFYLQILSRLRNLNDRLDKTIAKEKPSSFNPLFNFDLSGKLSFTSAYFKETHNFPVISSKETERELVEIFELMSDYEKNRNQGLSDDPMVRYLVNVPWLNKLVCSMNRFCSVIGTPIRLVYVLDELDKIEADTPTSQESQDKSRDRKEAIYPLLSSLKGFLNEAQAKFIFIGGREIYDATLADISDRETFYGSIFHENIYVHSFFKESSDYKSGLSLMTEQYLMKLLLPRPNDDQHFLRKFLLTRGIDPKENLESKAIWDTLEVYYWYLEYLHAEASERQDTSSPIQKNEGVIARKIEKIVFELQNFIMFLTYRSNGTPKKLVALIESYVMPMWKNADAASHEVGDYVAEMLSPIKVKHLQASNKTNLYLQLRYFDQYEVTLTSNLYRPYTLLHSRYNKVLSDKLLFSTAYIFDYILKFHTNGFSRRNLEAIPDIILATKDPNLRVYIHDLMKYMGRSQIRETSSAMFQYKYYNKTAQEIKLLSKISDTGSAAFNFTLDESLQIKEYYKKKLKELQTQHKEVGTYSQDNKYINSLGFLQNILGDLHYFDKEYDDAFLLYADSMQPLRTMLLKHDNPKSISSHQLVLFTRTQLKAGLTLEKMGAYDTAYSIYREIVTILEKFLKADADDANTVLKRSEIYLRPFIARLDVIEKFRVAGISYGNIKQSLSTFKAIHRIPEIEIETGKPIYSWSKSNKPVQITDSDRVPILLFDYFINVGSLLYLKNYTYIELFEEALNLKKTNVGNDNYYGIEKRTYPEYIGMLRVKAQEKHHNSEWADFLDYSPAFSAFYYYNEAAKSILKGYDERLKTKLKCNLEVILNTADFKIEAESAFASLVILLDPICLHLTNSGQLSALGNLFSKIGDALLSSAIKNDSGELEEVLINLFDKKASSDESTQMTELKKNSEFRQSLEFCFSWLNENSCKLLTEKQLEGAMVFYRIAGLFYLKANKLYSYNFMLKKVLFVVNDYLSIYRDSGMDGKGRLYDVCKVITIKIIRGIQWNTESVNRPQILKYKYIFNQDSANKPVIFNQLTTSTEVREALLLCESVGLKTGNYAFQKNTLINPYNGIGSMYLRMMELRNKSEQNEHYVLTVLGLPGYTELNRDFAKAPREEKKILLERAKNELKLDEKYEALVEVCLDSLFCLSEVLKVLNLFGVGYITNHSYLATTHYYMAKWCLLFYILEQYAKENPIAPNDDARRDELLRNGLKRIMGADAHHFVEAKFHFERAANHYHYAIQTHTGGKAYKDNIVNMSYLDDDTNDNLTLFCVALERFKMNTGHFRKRINDIAGKYTSDSNLYVYDAYL